MSTIVFNYCDKYLLSLIANIMLNLCHKDLASIMSKAGFIVIVNIEY